MTAVIVIEAVVIALLLLLVAGLLKSHAEILRRLDRLEGSSDTPSASGSASLRASGLAAVPATSISGSGPDGSSVTISLEHRDSVTLLAFLSSGCASCRLFWTQLREGVELPTPNTRPLVVTKGPRSESPAKIRELASDGIPVLMSDDVWDEFRVPLTPYFMLVGNGGTVIGEGSASSMEHLVSLFRQAVDDSDPTRMGTRDRELFTDEQLSRSGIEPGDASLYQDPLSE